MSSTFSGAPPSGRGVAAVAFKESEALKRLTERIIGCAIEVHRQLGRGLLEGRLANEFQLAAAS